MPATPDSRILSHIVRSMKTQTHDPLTPLIDEYLIKRKQPDYAHLLLREHVLDVGERPRPPGRFSPSSLCGCERQAVLKFTGMQGSVRLDPDQELIFEDGKWRHHKWQAMFKEMEQILGRDRFRLISIEEHVQIPGLFLAGHLDALIAIYIDGKWIRYVVDFKGANNWAFETAFRSQAPDPKYVFQILAYMRARKCRRGIILMDSKDKNRYTCFMISFTPEQWAQVRLWIKSVMEQMENQKLPAKHPECSNGTFLYNRCMFKSLCFGRLTDRQLERKVYKDFVGLDALWEMGNETIAAHEGD